MTEKGDKANIKQRLVLAEKRIEGLEVSRSVMKEEIARLREARNFYRSFVDDAFFGAKVGIILLDSEFKVVWASRSIERFFGLSAKEMIGKDKRQLVRQKIKTIFENAKEFEQRVIASYEDNSYVENFKCHVLPGPNRKERWLEHWSEPVEKGFFGKGRIEAYVDITERERLYNAFKKSEEKFRLLSENALDIIFSLAKDGSITYVNPVVKEILGFDSQEIIGSYLAKLAREQDQKPIFELFRRVTDAGEVLKNIVVTVLDRSGKEHEFLLSCSAVERAEGEDDDIAVVGMLKDITEERRLERQLRQAQKMEALGTLAGGIAHDFNNILSPIIGYSELALIDLPEDSAVRENIQHVLMAANRARDLVKQILNFSRQSEQERMPISIVPIVKEALKLLKASLPSTIRIVQEIDKDIGIIEADPTEIQQVLMNLCTNAEHAMGKDGGVLKVKLDKVKIEKGRLLHTGELQRGSYIKLTVSDTGHGMERHVIDRIFDPYFTTKKRGEGTGLGLAVVHGIIESYGGGIEVSSEPGKGSIFEIYFPASETLEVREEAAETALPTGHESILFIDDEEMLAEAGRLMLEELGYKVMTRTSSVEALELFRADPRRFDLVITDLTMPNITGDNLASRILEIRPDIPIILCTGFSTKITQEKVREMGISHLLMKPISMKELAKAVRTALDRDRRGKNG